jgi:hypothetical protein
MRSLIHRVWPGAMIALGLSLTAAWTGLLAYGFITLLEIAIFGWEDTTSGII